MIKDIDHIFFLLNIFIVSSACRARIQQCPYDVAGKGSIAAMINIMTGFMNKYNGRPSVAIAKDGTWYIAKGYGYANKSAEEK